MTTNHTAILEAADGTFEEFVWSCARAMGANMGMREEDPGIPIYRYEPDTYHLEELGKARLILQQFESMSLAEARAYLDEQHARFTQQWEEAGVWVRTVRAKLVAAREKAVAWKPPTKDHEGLKRYMLEQIDNDLSHAMDEETYQRRKPERVDDASSWLAQRVEYAKEWIAQCQQRYDEDVAHAKTSNDWNDALAKSVTPVFKGR